MYDAIVNKKIVKQLGQKKYRQELGLFLVQGRKSVDELLHSKTKVEHIYCTPAYAHERNLEGYSVSIVDPSELKQLGTLEENDSVIAVVSMHIYGNPVIVADCTIDGAALFLDSIRDPGNLGTIIRTADWFGIQTLFTSPDTVDFFNAKSIAASMGSFARVRTVPCTYDELFALSRKSGAPLAVLALNGTDIYTAPLARKCIFVMGSESHGVSGLLQEAASVSLTIPKYGGAESLNVATATGIVLSEYRRRGL